MSNMNEWNNTIKEKLGAFEEAPPAYMWDKIASGIPSTVVKVAFYRTLTFKVFVAAASIILLLFFAWTWSDSSKRDKLNLTKNDYSKTTTIKPFNNKSSENDKPLLKETSRIENKANKINNSSENLNSTSTDISTNKADNLISQSANKSGNYNTELVKTVKIATNENINTVTNESSEDDGISSRTTTENIAGNNQVTEINSHNSNSKIAAEIASSEIVQLQENNEIAFISQQPEKVSSQELNTTNPNAVSENNISSQNNETIEEQNIERYPAAKIIDSLNAITEIISPEAIPNTNFNPKTRNFNRVGIGVHYGLESIKMNNNQLLSNNIDLSFNFQNLNFILQSGVGIQLSQDVRNYYLEYMRNDYLATEMRFDSVVFTQDSIGQVSVVPVNPYYTDVYDSIHHTHNASYFEKYYSIRIPVMIGYQKDFKKFGLFSKGGVFYSRVIYKQRTAIYEPDESSRMIKLDYSGNDRVSNQIEYVLAAGLVYRFNRNLQFSGEIMTKFFQNSLYDNPDYSNMNTWSIEGRVGLMYFIN